MGLTILTGPDDYTPQPGWPCMLSSSGAPPIDDILSAPASEILLPQVLQLTPRGAAWGTDEAGDGQGASPVQLSFWSALAAWLAEIFASAFDVLRPRISRRWSPGGSSTRPRNTGSPTSA